MKRINKNIGYFNFNGGAYAFGENIFNELNVDAFEDLIFKYTNEGYNIEKKYKKLYFEVYRISGFTDPRLWPNRIAGYCGRVGATASTAIAATATSIDSKLFGVQPFLNSFRMLKEIVENKLKTQKEIELFLEKKYSNYNSIPGFSRIVNQHDERVYYIVKKIKEENIENNKYIKAAKHVQDVMREKYKSKSNMIFINAAIFLAIGFKNEKALSIATNFCFINAAMPSYIDGLNNSNEFIEIYDDEIIYEGESGLKWKKD